MVQGSGVFMDFIEGRLRVEDADLGWLSGLLSELNRSCRSVFARSIAKDCDLRSLSEVWAAGAGCFTHLDGSDAQLTSHQKGMVVRHAKNLRTTANARAKWASGHLNKLALG